MQNPIFELTRIVQQAALVEDTTQQVQLIVDSICQTVSVDVCSLYRADDEGDMVLLASHGLRNRGPIVIPKGRGLVGLVAKHRHSENLADAQHHPDYFYVPKTEEERFRSFCGVPLVKSGVVIGVLVVQRIEPQALSPESEGFLVTLASQLALLIANIPTHLHQEHNNQRIRGIKSAPGIGIAQTHLCAQEGVMGAQDQRCDDSDKEILLWQALLENVKQRIAEEKNSLSAELSDTVKNIFDAHLMLLSDPSFLGQVEHEIRLGHCLPYALKLSVQFFAEMFKSMDDPYLRARHEDILHLGNKLYSAWLGEDDSQMTITHPVVLVGPQISVSDIAAVPVELLKGIVCFEGSSMSHTSVLANAMGVPAVMGVGTLKDLSNNEAIIVDGNEGQVILHPTGAIQKEFKKLIQKQDALKEELSHLKDLPAQTPDGELLELFTNTGLLADITPGLNSGAQGIGLYRTEIPFMVRDSFPSEDEQIEVYARVLNAYEGKPVYMRTLDIGGDKQLPYFPITQEDNPALGWRGIRFSLDNIQLLMTQVRAMIRASQDSQNLHILLPMINSYGELLSFKQVLADAMEQLQEEGYAVATPKVGVMIEVPAAISQIPLWAEHLDFVSIGSNDLSQYLLALDRNNAKVADRYDHLHPAVVREVQRVVSLCHEAKLSVSLCGEMAADPMAVVLLMGMGMRRISMSAAKLPGIKWLIRSIPLSVAEHALAACQTMRTVEEIRTYLTDVLEENGLHALLRTD